MNKLRFLYIVFYYTSVINFFFWINRRKQIVVTYHNVINDNLFDSAPHLGVSNRLSEFNKQLGLILTKLKVVTEIGISQSCIITFDDGYRNNYTVALPVLQKHRVKAYFFIPVSMLEGSEILWVDKMLLWISYAPKNNYVFFSEFSISLDSQNRLEAWKTMWQWLMKNYSFKSILLNRMEELFSFQNIQCDKELFQSRFGKISLDEINEMKEHGNLIGAHSVAHDVLSKLTNLFELKQDFNICYSFVGSFYNTRIYSYPFGGDDQLNSNVFQACKEAGFTSAFVNFDSKVENNLSISRLSLGNTTDKYTIYAKISGLESFLRKLKKIVYG